MTSLSLFTFTFHCHALEKEMATHSSVLAWGISGMGEPGELTSMGSHRVGHDGSDLAAAAAAAAVICDINQFIFLQAELVILREGFLSLSTCSLGAVCATPKLLCHL